MRGLEGAGLSQECETPGTSPPLIMLLTPDPIWGTFISRVFRDLQWNKKQESIALPCSLQTKEGGAA